MILDVLLGSMATLAFAWGTRQALCGSLKASSWLAGGSAIVFLLATRFPGSFEVTVGLLSLGVVGVSAGGALLAREVALKRDRRLSLDIADEAVVREVLHDAEEASEHERPRSLQGIEEAH